MKMKRIQIVHEIADVMRIIKPEIYYCVSEYNFTPKDIVEKFIGIKPPKSICDDAFKEAIYSYSDLRRDLIDYANLREAELNGELTERKQEEAKQSHNYSKLSPIPEKSSRGRRVKRYGYLSRI